MKKAGSAESDIAKLSDCLQKNIPLPWTFVVSVIDKPYKALSVPFVLQFGNGHLLCLCRKVTPTTP